jgi:hypothetical protein
VPVLGLGGHARHYGDFGLGSPLTATHFTLGPPEFVNVATGPGKTLACIELAVVLLSTPAGPVALLVNRSHEHHGGPPLTVQATSPTEGSRAAGCGGRRRRPPDGALERIERHVLGPTRHRDALVSQGRHLSRGLLLWGPPGTGKTHTVRYLTGRVEGVTTILLSGATLGMLSAFGALARRLAPSVVVLDDVDLIAQERTYGPFGESERTEGVTASFVKELLRRAALEPAEAGRATVTDREVAVALDDLFGETGALTRALLGVRRTGDPEPGADPHAWVRGWAGHG